MLIDNKILVGLPVETKSGLLLGKIKSFEIESEMQVAEKYVVKSRSLIGKFLGKETGELIIRRNQVIFLDDAKMIVEDGTVGERDKVLLSQGVGKDIPVLSSKLSLEGDGK